MDPSPRYANAYHQPGQSRYASSHATSSAFSTSANPNEDWTKISDLAERRRIQNRIAQRNYRKKLKSRLEDLERRAASTSPSPDVAHSELVTTRSPETSTSSSRSASHHSSRSSTHRPESFLPSQAKSDDDHASLFPQQETRQLSASPPPLFSSYASFEPSDDGFYTPYPQQAACHASPSSYADYSYQDHFLSTLPPTLPAMPAFAPSKEPAMADDDYLSPFSMTYASMAGIEVPPTHSYTDFRPQTETPPLSESYCFDDSRESSPSQFIYPDTPISTLASPKLALHDFV